MTTKRWFALAIVLVAAPLLVGCGGVAKTGGEGPNSSVAMCAPLIQDLQSSDLVTVLTAESKLKDLGMDALPALVDFAKQPPVEGDAQARAVRLIGSLGNQAAAQALVDLLLNGAPSLNKDIKGQLIRLDKLTVDPLIAAIPKASGPALADISEILLLNGDKLTVDKIVYSMNQYLHRQTAQEGPQPDPAMDARFRQNMTGVMRAMTGQSMGFDRDASVAEQNAVLEKWISWWGKNRDIVDITR